MNNWLKRLINPLLLSLVIPGAVSGNEVIKTDSLIASLKENSAILRQHSTAETARLKVIDFSEAQKRALKKDKHIAGFPIVDKLMIMEKDQSLKIAKMLIDKNNYINVRQRCVNKFYQGVRFVEKDKNIEIAIGIPCNQVLAVYNDNSEVKWWGGHLSENAIKKLLPLLCKKRNAKKQ